MTPYSNEPKNRIIVKCCGFLSFSENMNKNIVKDISKNVRGIYSLGVSATGQKLFDYVKKSITNVLKITSKRTIQKTAEATGYLIGNNQ